MSDSIVSSSSGPQRFETVWPDKSFARFGGHVLQRLIDLHHEIKTLGDRRFKVKVVIEVEPMPEEIADPSQESALDQTKRKRAGK